MEAKVCTVCRREFRFCFQCAGTGWRRTLIEEVPFNPDSRLVRERRCPCSTVADDDVCRLSPFGHQF